MYACDCSVILSLDVLSRFNFPRGLEESNSRVFLTVSFGDEVVVFISFCFLADSGCLCHRASDKLISLSEDPCQLDVFSTFLPLCVKVIPISEIYPPLKILMSVF